MRLVIDTNVLIAAFISHGVCSEVLEHCVLNHDVVLSGFILDELKEKLVGRFKYTTREANGVVTLLKSRCSIVGAPVLPSPVSRDPDDDNIIATAIAGSCRCIVSGDKDLLDLKQAGDILIVSPSQFWRIETT
jgi:putative PIN family toxin of toxin-antitoxin system